MRPTPSRAAARVAVARATAADLAFVVALQKRYARALGFIPRAGLREKIDRGQVWVARRGGMPAGFLHHGSLAGREGRVFQAAVDPAACRGGVGRALVEDLARRAAGGGCDVLSVRCLAGLAANAFWPAAGFALAAVEPGARGNLNVWVRRLDVGDEPAAGEAGAVYAAAPAAGLVFHSRLHPCPVCGRPTTDTWARGAIRRRLCGSCAKAGGGR